MNNSMENIDKLLEEHRKQLMRMKELDAEMDISRAKIKQLEIMLNKLKYKDDVIEVQSYSND